MMFTDDGRSITTIADDNNFHMYTTSMTFWLEKKLIVFRDETGNDERAKYRIEGNKLTIEQDGIANVLTKQD